MLNAVYLYHCTKAGLDYAIVNTEKLQRFAFIPEEEIKLSEGLLFHNSDETLSSLLNFTAQKSQCKRSKKRSSPYWSGLLNILLKGQRKDLKRILNEALEKEWLRLISLTAH